MTEPDWSLLPHDPGRFLGLGENFEHRELKRAYSRLIKKFKPEIYPEQFRLIRDAFERLENQLQRREKSEPRFPQRNSIPSEPQWLKSPATDRSENFLQAVPETTAEQLYEQTPEQWYQRLKELPVKQAEEYIQLAFLTDEVEGDDKVFFSWLLEGVKQYPRHLQLHESIRNYSIQPHPLPHLIWLLEQAKKRLDQSLFLRLTDTLWLQLARVNFYQFEQLWNLLIQPDQVFYLEDVLPIAIPILKVSVWQSSQTWSHEILQMVDEHPRLVPDNLEIQVEMYELLNEYHMAANKLRWTFPDRFKPYQNWHDKLQEFCLAEPTQACQFFHAYQKQLVSSFAEWEPTFKGNNYVIEYESKLATCWSWLAILYADASSTLRGRLSNEAAQRSTLLWMQLELIPCYQHSWFSFCRKLSMLICSLLLTGIFTFSFTVFLMAIFLTDLSSSAVNSKTAETNGLVAVVIGLFAGLAIILKMLPKYQANLNQLYLPRLNITSLRKIAALFFQQQLVTMDQFRSSLHYWKEHEAAHYSTELKQSVEQIATDPALIIYCSGLEH